MPSTSGLAKDCSFILFSQSQDYEVDAKTKTMSTNMRTMHTSNSIYIAQPGLVWVKSLQACSSRLILTNCLRICMEEVMCANMDNVSHSGEKINAPFFLTPSGRWQIASLFICIKLFFAQVCHAACIPNGHLSFLWKSPVLSKIK